MAYVGLDIHKKVIAFCIKTDSGAVIEEGKIDATRRAMTDWVARIDRPWIGAMEATLFTGWIYDFLKPHARELKVAHPKMLKAISASKKKNDRVDAAKIADLLRCDLLPECHVADVQTRELRRVLRYRNLVVRQAVLMKNKMAGLLMEVGTEYSKNQLHGKGYFDRLVTTAEDIPESVIDLLKMSRASLEMFQAVERRLRNALKNSPALRARVERLSSIAGVGDMTALTWALEIGDVSRFSSRRKVISYCGLCSAQKESAGKSFRSPLSKDRNKHLQTVLIEAAKIAPRWNPELAALYERELKRGNRNRATLAVARRIAVWLLAVDRKKEPFENRFVSPDTSKQQAA
jgi:transposase